MIMKAKDFRALLAELGSLTTVQRHALMVALSSQKSAGDVVALIEAEFAKAPACGHCGSEAFSRWGVATGMKRYMCKACERTFNALTGTPLAHLQKREKWLEYARAIVDGLSLRKAAKRVGVHLDTSFRWRHRFLATSKGAKAAAVTGIVEADETFILKSAKGSKRLVGRAPRKRGGKAKKGGLSTEEHDCVLIVRDRSGATTDHVLPDLTAPTFAARLAPIVAKDAVLVSDGRDAYGAFAHAEDILHIPIITSRGEHAYKGFHIQNVNAYTSRLKDWMRPFKGVASWYLPSYLGWRRAIERLGENFTPERCLQDAYRCAST
jgi:transposase-like protein